MNYNPKMANYFSSLKVFNNDPFVLIDVGASGGISTAWNCFGSDLVAYGFDPLIMECEKLNKENLNPKIKYFDAYVIAENDTFDKFSKEFVDQQMSVFSRSSASKVAELKNINYTQNVFNSNQELKFSSNKISLDRFIYDNNITNVDFVKIDTDGYDYSVLQGSKSILGNKKTLGFLIECEVSGSKNEQNLFRNVDALLTSNDFTLFDFTTHRYSKSALPANFVYVIPAQTLSGQICWGDALYLRDFVKASRKGESIEDSQLLKMASLFEIFGLYDCAAELLIEFRTQLKSVIDVDQSLNYLAQQIGEYSTYQSHMNKFLNAPESFYPVATPVSSINESINDNPNVQTHLKKVSSKKASEPSLYSKFTTLIKKYLLNVKTPI